MREIALHLLDITENSVAANAQLITVWVDEDLYTDRLTIQITDDGKGMDAETAHRVLDPFVTSRSTRKVGLGLPLLKAAAESCNGGLWIASVPGKGTQVKVAFQHSHIDRIPLGDVGGTILTLVVAHPELHWRLEYTATDAKGHVLSPFIFDDAPVKEALGNDVPLSQPDVLAYLRSTLEEGIGNIRNQLYPASVILNGPVRLTTALL